MFRSILSVQKYRLKPVKNGDWNSLALARKIGWRNDFQSKPSAGFNRHLCHP